MTDIRDEVAQTITMALIERPDGSGLTWNEATAAGHDVAAALAARGLTVVRVELLYALEGLRDEGYQPSYNGRPSCPFCYNFVDDEETHAPGCVLVYALRLLIRQPEGQE